MSIDEINELLTGEALTWQNIVAAILLVSVGLFLSYLIGRWRRHRLGRPDGQSQQLVALTARIIQSLVIAVFVGWALTILGSDVGLLTVMVIVAVLILVLAARPVIEGMGASAALTTRPAFTIGDEVQVDDYLGEIVEITNRSTVIRLRDARRVHIPNVEMLNKTVIVFTNVEERRSSIDLVLDLGEDIDRTDKVLRDALDGVDSINRVGSVRARALDVGVDLSVRIWHGPEVKKGNDALDDAVRAMKTALESNGINLAPSSEVAVANLSHGSNSKEPASSFDERAPTNDQG
ncbi:MAG: mechanosensitive ion channel family protein [Microthrixaceae bacterium]